MNKISTRLFTIFTLTALIVTAFGVSIVTAESEISDTELETDEISNIEVTDTIEFTLKARWGFVLGNPDENKTEKEYEGYVKSGNYALAKINLKDETEKR